MISHESSSEDKRVSAWRVIHEGATSLRHLPWEAAQSSCLSFLSVNILRARNSIAALSPVLRFKTMTGIRT